MEKQIKYCKYIVILGIPLINSICGENVTGLTYLMVAIVVPMFNVLAVICVELFNTKKGNMLRLLQIRVIDLKP